MIAYEAGRERDNLRKFGLKHLQATWPQNRPGIPVLSQHELKGVEVLARLDERRAQVGELLAHLGRQVPRGGAGGVLVLGAHLGVVAGGTVAIGPLIFLLVSVVHRIHIHRIHFCCFRCPLALYRFFGKGFEFCR